MSEIEIIIKGNPEKIAALVAALQGRRYSELVFSGGMTEAEYMEKRHEAWRKVHNCDGSPPCKV